MFNPDNLVSNEIHALDNSVGVIFNEGAFYDNEVLRIEGSTNGTTYTPLRRNIDYLFSPAFVREMARVGIGVYSYIVIMGDFTHVKLTYEKTPADVGVDEALLSKVASDSFDRMDKLAWMAVDGNENYNPRFRNPVLAARSEIEVFNDGLGKIEEALRGHQTGDIDNALQQQVTALEVRQTNIEDSQTEIIIEFNGVKTEFQDIQQLFSFITQKMLYGGGSNASSEGGFAYVQEVEQSVHTIVHNLQSTFLDVTIWVQNPDSVFEYAPMAPTKIVDSNTIEVDTGVPTKLIAVVRHYEAMSDRYSFQSANPDVNHTITHNLNTGFPSCSIWEEDGNGDWIYSIADVTMLSKNQISITFPSAKNVRAIIQRPIANGYIYKSDSASDLQRIFHRLMTPYFTLSLWKKNADFTYSRILGEAAIIALSTLEVTLNTAEVIKAVLQPIVLTDPNFELDIHNQITELKDTHIVDDIDLQTQIDNLVLNGSGNVISFSYDSVIDGNGPALTHTITHNLNTTFLQPTVWVQNSNGDYEEEYMRIVSLDANTIELYLTVSANVRVLLLLP